VQQIILGLKNRRCWQPFRSVYIITERYWSHKIKEKVFLVYFLVSTITLYQLRGLYTVDWEINCTRNWWIRTYVTGSLYMSYEWIYLLVYKRNLSNNNDLPVITRPKYFEPIVSFHFSSWFFLMQHNSGPCIKLLVSVPSQMFTQSPFWWGLTIVKFVPVPN
jgi:hypothetical protein